MVVSFVVILLGLLAGLIVFWRVPLARRVPGLPDHDSLELARHVTVIIPAYNEAGRLPVLLASLKVQDIQPHELFVVDDGSTDATRSIAQQAGFRVLDADATLSDWVGKSRACWSGARAATGDWLLFLDADTRLSESDSLRRILATYHNLGGRGGLSLQPWHTLEHAYENLSVVFNIIVMAGIGVFTLWGTRLRGAGLFGPCLLCNRADYFQVGGHRAIRDQVMDDLALGQSLQKAGLPAHSLGGRGVLTFRMYPEGLRSLWEGWSKNMSTGAAATHPLVFTLIILWICAGFSSLTAVIKAFGGPPLVLAAAGIACLLYMLLFIRMARLCGRFWRWPLLFYPVFLTFFTLVFLWSVLLTRVLHVVTWKGRRIKV
ncbi:MAG: glycosyltransferase [Clostridiaceae bacterium]|nr:glycosyltransferase [Clostridiaceae bacterium]